MQKLEVPWWGHTGDPKMIGGEEEQGQRKIVGWDDQEGVSELDVM